MNKLFWRNKKVLITGHTGFKGSWLCQLLLMLGADVYGYALEPNTSPSLFNLLSLCSKMTSKIADIRDYEALKEFVLGVQPDIIIHMAAQPLVRYSYQNPLETYEINVMGTANILNVVRDCESVKAVVNVTTDKAYENKEWVWPYRENDPMGGYDPYSSSKGCAELVTAAFRQSYFNPKDIEKHGKAIASARAGNVIGGGDWSEDRLIPDIIRSFEHLEPVVVRNPHAIRPWQHVLEPLSGYLKLAEKMWGNPQEFSSAWNFGPYNQDCKPVSFLVENMVLLWGNNASWKIDDAAHPHEANFLKLDISKAETHLHWRPKWNISQVLVKTLDWYKRYCDNGEIIDITQNQINEYINLE